MRTGRTEFNRRGKSLVYFYGSSIKDVHRRRGNGRIKRWTTVDEKGGIYADTVDTAPDIKQHWMKLRQ